MRASSENWRICPFFHSPMVRWAASHGMPRSGWCQLCGLTRSRIPTTKWCAIRADQLRISRGSQSMLVCARGGTLNLPLTIYVQYLRLRLWLCHIPYPVVWKQGNAAYLFDTTLRSILIRLWKHLYLITPCQAALLNDTCTELSGYLRLDYFGFILQYQQCTFFPDNVEKSQRHNTGILEIFGRPNFPNYYTCSVPRVSVSL